MKYNNCNEHYADDGKEKANNALVRQTYNSNGVGDGSSSVFCRESVTMIPLCVYIATWFSVPPVVKNKFTGRFKNPLLALKLMRPDIP